MRMLLGLASLVAIALPSSVNAQSTIVTQGFSASSGSGRIHRATTSGGASPGCRVATGAAPDWTATGADGAAPAKSPPAPGSMAANGRSTTTAPGSSDSYNDWWHDQPWRSYPRWVSKNEDCQRLWWSGGGWRC